MKKQGDGYTAEVGRNKVFLARGSGLLMHVTSLPGPGGIGDLGRGSREFLDFLAAAEQQYWQFLPLVPTCGVFGHSPYASFSAFAGNPLLIDPQGLVDEGLLSGTDLRDAPIFSEYLVEFDQVEPWKKALLRRAFAAFLNGGGRSALEQFGREEAWLEDYALFMALRHERRGDPWYQWPAPLAARDGGALAKARRRLAEAIQFHRFEQYCFFRQLGKLRSYAAERGVRLIGDLPIYVGLDSADVWALQDGFYLDPKTRGPVAVAGVPPDYFSATGQRWGNPLYQWHDADQQPNEPLFQWWKERFRHTFRMMDIVRVDHFRGFAAYWAIPAAEETAVNGQWVTGPGRPFFERMVRELGPLAIIAEDLGFMTTAVEELRDGLGLPGMKILQFAFDSDAANLYLPHNFSSSHCVVYTATHDNDTVVGWYLSPGVAAASKQRAVRYANHPGTNEINWDFIRLAFASTAITAIIPTQDVLGFGADCRMNFPGIGMGNWRWRCAARYLNDAVAGRLADETRFYGRGRVPGQDAG